MRGSVIRGEGILEGPFQRWGPGRARSGAGGAGVARARDRRDLSAEPGAASCMVPCQPRGGVRRPRAELGEGALGGKLIQETGPTCGWEPRLSGVPGGELAVG